MVTGGRARRTCPSPSSGVFVVLTALPLRMSLAAGSGVNTHSSEAAKNI